MSMARRLPASLSSSLSSVENVFVGADKALEGDEVGGGAGEEADIVFRLAFNLE